MKVTPHVAAKSKGSAIDGRTTRHAGYAISRAHPQAHRRAVRLEQDRWADGEDHAARPGSGRRPVIFNLAAYNLVCLRKLPPHKREEQAAGHCMPATFEKAVKDGVPFRTLRFFSSLLAPEGWSV